MIDVPEIEIPVVIVDTCRWLIILQSHCRVPCVGSAFAIALLAGLLQPVCPTSAQVLPDASLGQERSIVTPQATQNLITGGAIRGNNLFHSFQQFSINAGNTVRFNPPSNTTNIFSRVTGTAASNIQGTLGVIGNANLFLLNPNGILFGPNAQLDLAGSFAASTSNRFLFDNAEYSAITPNAAPLLTISVPLGIQYGENTPDRLIRNEANLTLAPQQQLTFDAGTIEQAGNISIPAGTVNLRSENLSMTGQISTGTAEGQFGILRLSSPIDLTIGTTSSLTNATINQALQNNEVVVESDRNLTLIGPLTGNSPAPLTLRAGNNLALLTDGSGRSQLAGNTTLQSGNDLLVENQLVVSSEQPNPQLKLEAGGDILLRDSPLIENNLLGGILVLSGNNGTLSIQAKTLTMQANGFTLGSAGNPVLSITVASRVASLDQRGPDVDIVVSETINFQSGTGILSFTGNDLSGNGQTGGNIRLNAKRIILDGSTQQSQIVAATNFLSHTKSSRNRYR